MGMPLRHETLRAAGGGKFAAPLPPPAPALPARPRDSCCGLTMRTCGAPSRYSGGSAMLWSEFFEFFLARAGGRPELAAGDAQATAQRHVWLQAVAVTRAAARAQRAEGPRAVRLLLLWIAARFACPRSFLAAAHLAHNTALFVQTQLRRAAPAPHCRHQSLHTVQRCLVRLLWLVDRTFVRGCAASFFFFAVAQVSNSVSCRIVCLLRV